MYRDIVILLFIYIQSIFIPLKLPYDKRSATGQCQTLRWKKKKTKQENHANKFDIYIALSIKIYHYMSYSVQNQAEFNLSFILLTIVVLLLFQSQKFKCNTPGWITLLV